MAGDEVDVVVGVLEDHAFPRPEGRHRPVGTAADDELEVRVHLAHGLGDLARDLAVVLGAAMAELPWPVHLVAETPHAHIERIGRAVCGPQLGQGGACTDVRVLEQVERL